MATSTLHETKRLCKGSVEEVTSTCTDASSSPRQPSETLHTRCSGISLWGGGGRERGGNGDRGEIMDTGRENGDREREREGARGWRQRERGGRMETEEREWTQGERMKTGRERGREGRE